MNVRENDCDLFKTVFKQYKRKAPPPDLSNVIDFEKSQKFRDWGVVKCDDEYLSCEHGCLTGATSTNSNTYSTNCPGPNFVTQEVEKTNTNCKNLGLKPIVEWRLFTLNTLPGFIFISNPFTPEGQQMWIRNCLLKYPMKPNITNLGESTNSDIFDDHLLTNLGTEKFNILNVKKLRWTTLGYHHNWDTKVYSRDMCSPFPESLKNLSVFVARILGFGNFQPEAAIINYYHKDSTLGGHTDHSEFDLSAPLFSFSFGQTALFLIGGNSKAVSPMPIFIRSGDVVVMSGASRLAYHGVPKIILTEKGLGWKSAESNNSDWKQYDDYLKNYRINMNVRQVWP
ncbi:nucleic acid dioxygenase ALKBH1-like [Limulus polyphemus]|uniref:Nucleic acid dioxygenase ALKBH1-like n=1 Tax=Limulus polyphemus TaxID=6850 RepID=A0ABM1B3X1_LIMPO|nr:nucleic acid dioxygenase ALKBH1-like [Limulus polyphemus]